MFTKKDLQDGDLVVLRNGGKRIYKDGFFRFQNFVLGDSTIDYMDNLLFKFPKSIRRNNPFDIMEVYRGEKAKNFVCSLFELIYYRSKSGGEFCSEDCPVSDRKCSTLDMLTEMGFTEE